MYRLCTRSFIVNPWMSQCWTQASSALSARIISPLNILGSKDCRQATTSCNAAPVSPDSVKPTKSFEAYANPVCGHQSLFHICRQMSTYSGKSCSTLLLSDLDSHVRNSNAKHGKRLSNHLCRNMSTFSSEEAPGSQNHRKIIDAYEDRVMNSLMEDRSNLMRGVNDMADRVIAETGSENASTFTYFKLFPRHSAEYFLEEMIKLRKEELDIEIEQFIEKDSCSTLDEFYKKDDILIVLESEESKRVLIGEHTRIWHNVWRFAVASPFILAVTIYVMYVLFCYFQNKLLIALGKRPPV